MNYIDEIKDQLDENMHKQCVVFTLIGTPSESPRWMNFGGFDNESKVLTIQSTQRSGIFFNVETDFDFVEVHEFWEEFKKYRTDFLTDNYPTISTY
jgi:hypothetical protein